MDLGRCFEHLGIDGSQSSVGEKVEERGSTSSGSERYSAILKLVAVCGEERHDAEFSLCDGGIAKGERRRERLRELSLVWGRFARQRLLKSGERVQRKKRGKVAFCRQSISLASSNIRKSIFRRECTVRICARMS